MPNFWAGISVECQIPSPVPIKSSPSPEEILFDQLLWSDGSALKNSSLQFLSIRNDKLSTILLQGKWNASLWLQIFLMLNMPLHLFCANIQWISTCIRQTDCIHMTTSYCLPQLEEFCDMQKMMSTVQHNCQKTEELTETTWGRGFSNEHNRAEHFNHFLMKK